MALLWGLFETVHVQCVMAWCRFSLGVQEGVWLALMSLPYRVCKETAG